MIRRFATNMLPYAAALLAGAAFMVASSLARADVGNKDLLLAVPALFIAVAIAIASVLLVGVRTQILTGLRAAISPVILALSAYGYYLLIDRGIVRYAVVAAVAVLLAVYLEHVKRPTEIKSDKAVTSVQGERGDLTQGSEAYANLSFTIHFISVFFLSAFMLGLVQMTQASGLLLSLVMGFAVFVLMHETLVRFGTDPSTSLPSTSLGTGGTGKGSARTVSVIFGVVGAEIHVALSFLPTAHVVNAAVFTILYALGVLVAKTALQHGSGQAAVGGPEPAESATKALRRYVVISFILIILILVTARWL